MNKGVKQSNILTAQIYAQTNLVYFESYVPNSSLIVL